ncbi:MAG TPA: threonine synthase [Acidimicrobiia bacterium]|nr:threonine synthase [Acidimicrobiia bacterium]
MITPLSTRPLALTCFDCGASAPPGQLQTTCPACGMPLRVDLDLPGELAPEAAIDASVSSMWRYHGVLPVDREKAVSLTEGWTPLVDAGDATWIKDESRNPTGSFKARGMSMAVSAAVALGAARLVAPSAGNAAGALSAYGAAADIPVLVSMPADTPDAFVKECRHYGAEVELVPGTIADAGKWLASHRSPDDFDVSTLKEPYRIEGKKTMAYELWEQFAGDLPDVIVYPTGGGTGLVGMWKAFDEMEAMGWIGTRRPRMVSVQAAGCAPVIAAFEAGADRTEAWEGATTSAYGLRVPSPIGGFLCLRAIRETGGTALAVPEAEIAPAAAALASSTGVDVCPEGGAAWAALSRLRAEGWVGEDDRVVVFNTGTGLKYR